ncbi:hypothetical protein QQZ08_005039 [Neonectria magnoliae]|uniref:Arrestin-like N-terminal domain-containing protein n=1 Tax=Neonectria magnoliae TaxID=2732573 RepID=A0ABR1I5Z0_9HYPO
MPQTWALTNSKLGIRLEGGKTKYTPGDTVAGHAFRRTATVSPESSVAISLHGRAKSKTVVQHEHSSTSYRGRWDLVYPADHVLQLFEGPLHIETDNDEQVWPFSINLPSHIDPKCVEGRSESHSFLPLDRELRLPSTLELIEWARSKGDGTCGRMECFIEYWLQAELKISKNSDVETVEARLPFTITNPNPEDPNEDFAIEISGDSFEVRSFRLVPGMEDAKLSFPQRMKKKFSFFSSTIPRLSVDMQIDVSSEIQLNGPDSISFKLGLTPDWACSSEILRGVPQKAKLTWVSLRILTRTQTICEGKTGDRHVTREKVDETDLLVWEAIEALEKELYVPCTEESEAVDIGEMIDLRIGRHGRIVSDPPKDEVGSLSTGFATFNIRRTHALAWGLRGEVADRDFSASGEQTLTLIPSDAQPAERDREAEELEAPIPSLPPML